MVLDLFDKGLLIHELGQGLLLVNELKGHLRILLPRMDQLKDLVYRHLKAERPQDAAHSLPVQDLFGHVAAHQTGVELEVGPLVLLQTILERNQNRQMDQVDLAVGHQFDLVDHKCASCDLLVLQLDDQIYVDG